MTATELDDATERDDERLELAARAELLAEENRRLRAEYARARQSHYRRTALALLALAGVAVLGGVLFPDAREVLFVLGATGLFGGVLTYYLSPGQFVAADVGERVYAALSTNEAAIASQLGVHDDRVYLPPSGATPARLYAPQQAEFKYPDPDEHAGPIVTDPPHRGLLLDATGAALFDEFERALSGELATRPAAVATQLADGLVEQLELAARAEPDADAEDGRLTVAIADSAFGDVDRFDHPIPSFLAVGLATALDRPVTLDVDAGSERTDWLVTCRWER